MEGAGAPVGLGGAVSLVAMSARREFDVVILAEPEGGYSVFVPELPSVATQGETTIEEARANAQEAIEGYLEVMHEDGSPSPRSTATVWRSTPCDPSRTRRYAWPCQRLQTVMTSPYAPRSYRPSDPHESNWLSSRRPHSAASAPNSPRDIGERQPAREGSWPRFWPSEWCITAKPPGARTRAISFKYPAWSRGAI